MDATLGAAEPRARASGRSTRSSRCSPGASVSADELDFIELDEAFAAKVTPVLRAVGVDPYNDRVNPYGGAIAIEHRSA
jgi:acetyl-CoA acetyltransferase